MGVKAVLLQRFGEKAKMFPVAYFSRELTLAERNYNIEEKELISVKLALEECFYWLEGALHHGLSSEQTIKALNT